MGEKFYSQENTDRIPEHEIKPENFEMSVERAEGHLHDSFDTLFGSQMGGGYARSSEEGFSGDAASLFVLTSLQNEQKEEILKLIKVGWGEFSKETFEGDKYPVFKHFPLDIYCVSQSDSYFANERLRSEMDENPQKYLSEHILFFANNGKVQQSKRGESSKRHLEKDINAVPYAEMLSTVRNQIIKERTTPEEFAAFLEELPDDPTELGTFMSDIERKAEWMSPRELESADEETKAMAKKKRLMHILWGMGTERVGIAVGDKKAMESVLAIKKQFDFETKSF